MNNVQQSCHCGLPLHYADKRKQRQVEQLIKLYGENTLITIGDKTYIVPRHYIALHGIKGEDLHKLGFEEA